VPVRSDTGTNYQACILSSLHRPLNLRGLCFIMTGLYYTETWIGQTRCSFEQVSCFNSHYNTKYELAYVIVNLEMVSAILARFKKISDWLID